MYSNQETLKKMAFDYFVDGLAEAVGKQIEIDALKQAKNLPSATIDNGEFSIYSVATLFFADHFYDKLETGSFSGRLLLSWNGMDDFIFIHDENDPFMYTTAKGHTVRPNLMRTDGGSIPRILRGLKKFSSWGYGPAFIIHDWIFTAKKCNYITDENYSFEDSAHIMAEAMKTLMEVGYTNYKGEIIKFDKAEDTLYLMYHAVSSSIARDLWEDDLSVDCLLGN